ncbi:4-hydroxybenzoate octaprenyltransferase [Methylovirgula sp. 4M-Z18]|uniref:4-hydroxybenzoate octaprenyltransferase n=1 Tax=Methylovirgula sp. 4M-Z18 TaxID=2293567 RepID=UPI000E2F61E6|nr:4-hydroxybenzoate octaprenyltransferase [Methylovirgula sp. 4M-Z18]RFB78837.1 4-hydroxybenzoate octaprenyltransferase [Methylovirgula sp. 4M-Z18]
MSASAQLPDAARGNLFTRLAPPAFLPFVQLARLDRPIGWWLVLLPCWWSSSLAAVASHASPNLLHILLFLIGAMSMRGAGSTYNDLVDRDLDAKVERTKGRPLPSGRASVKAAILFLGAQAFIGFLVVISFNTFTILLSFASLLIVAIYPFMKRVTSWPQAVLGLAFAWGGLVGWSAFTGSLAWPAVLIYAAANFWTMGYDTIYALQDARDDAIAGIKSTARFFGSNVRSGVALLYTAAVILTALAAVLAHAGLLAWLGVAGFAAHLAWQVRSIEIGNVTLSLRLFRSNRDAGLILFAGFFLQALIGA